MIPGRGDCSAIIRLPMKDGLPKGKQRYSRRQSPIDDHSKVYLWQDKETASTAELLVAAFTGNGRAASIGEHSTRELHSALLN